MDKQNSSISLTSLAQCYFKLGSSAFGGWSTTLLLLERSFVDDRKLLTKRQLHSAVVSGQLLPGAAQVILATQAAYFIRGTRGAIVAITAYLLPSILLTITFSFLYFHFLHETDFSKHTQGLQAAIGGIIIGNAYRVGQRHADRTWLWLVAIISFVTYLFLHIPIIVILLVATFMGLVVAPHLGKKLNV